MLRKLLEVVNARLDEIDALMRMDTWEVAPVFQFIERRGTCPIKGRWVDINT